MSKIRLHGSSSGYTEIAPVAASGNNTLTLPNDGTIISQDAAGAVGVTSIVTTTATITTAKIGAGVTISESGIEASGIGITCANINGTQIGGRRNIVINGAMNVAQRGTSSTSVGYQTVDRIYQAFANTDEAPTMTQADLASTDAPYLLGFRKSYKVQNGNQTSGAGAADEMTTTYNVEAQDLAQSGWDYTSSSSNITISFWVKSSVAQQFQVNMRIYPDSGDQKEFCFEYTLSANTWTKVIKTIPGASGNVLRNTNELGMFITFAQFYGTDYTANTRAFDTWETKNNNQNFKDYATDWYTTNDATWEITGLQLEVGPQATPFEHRSYGEELSLCQRYYYTAWKGSGNGDFVTGSDTQTACEIGSYSSSEVYFVVIFPELMRDAPTLKTANVSSGLTIHRNAGSVTIDQGGWTNIIQAGKRAARVYTETGSNRLSGNVSSGEPYALRMTAAGVYMAFDAEL